MFPAKITKDEINKLPLVKYEGSIELIEEKNKLGSLLKEIKRETFIGFDTESKPAFTKGVYNPVALLQVATQNCVFLVRTNKIGFPLELANIFQSPSILKVGISIRDDIKDLQFLAPFAPVAIEELNQIAGTLGIQNEGVRALVGIFLGKRVSKSQQISNWENEELTPSQKVYAATDAWVCYQIYDKLLKQGYI